MCHPRKKIQAPLPHVTLKNFNVKLSKKNFLLQLGKTLSHLTLSRFIFRKKYLGTYHTEKL